MSHPTLQSRCSPAIWIFTLLIVLGLNHLCAAQSTTLKDFLISNDVPTRSFSKTELSQMIEGLQGFARDGEIVFLAYIQRKGNSLIGDPQIVRYDTKSRTLLRRSLPIDELQVCGGSPEGFSFLTKYVLLSFHYNPSAGCMVVLDDHLALRARLFGFSAVEISPEQIVFVEDMMHFAPIQPERLQWVNLRTRTSRELYPPKNDPLRALFVAEHAKHIPDEKTCAANNDFCDPSGFDEEVGSLQVLGPNSFSLLADWNASHATKPEETPETVVSQSIRYIYAFKSGSWRYCEESVSSIKVSKTPDSSTPSPSDLRGAQGGSSNLEPTCDPQTPVVADDSTSGFSPFPRPELLQLRPK
jgi:hypothetical protein